MKTVGSYYGYKMELLRQVTGELQEVQEAMQVVLTGEAMQPIM